MKSVFTFVLLSLAISANAATVLKCAVQNVRPEGVRINLIQNSAGDFRANLIFGTTVSGVMFQVQQVKPGVFRGSIKGKPQFAINLVVSSIQAANSSISGYKASLEAIYPDLRNTSGMGKVKTSSADAFVCGKQTDRF